MKVMFDANILLDVFQHRQPHYDASATCVNAVLRGALEGYIPAHIATTFYYVLAKYRDEQTARDALHRLLRHFTVAPCDHAMLQEALACALPDFEDAVVYVSAYRAGCVCIVTRNPNDYIQETLRIVSPQALINEQGL